MINVKIKGKRVELELVKILKDYGFNARRSQQYCGSSDSADVIVDNLPVHIECKGDQTVTSKALQKAVAQAMKDCPEGNFRVVIHKVDGGGKRPAQWYATMPVADWMDLIKEWKERSK